MARGILFDEDAARDVARRLRHDGYAATTGRERYAGEDDDADHAWVIETDAPAVALDLLLEAHDGWLDDEQPEDSPTPAAPQPLPDAPRRRHRD